MIISTPEELRLYLPTHVLDDISNVAGAIDNSVHDFLCERIGAPLLESVEKYYHEHYLLDDGTPNDEAIQADLLAQNVSPLTEVDPYVTLIGLCQRCVVFDAFARLADIQTLSVHDAGINVVETKGYDSAPDKTIANYKSQMVKEAHAASNRLLIWLEELQKSVSIHSSESEELNEEELSPSPSGEGRGEAIIELWKKSAYYYFADGLLFNTATEFGLYVNIYDSREKFIQLLPDIRYCQETHIEAEIGEELLLDLINKHKAGALNAVEKKAYEKLQRTLSIMVEARSQLFKRPEAKDEAQGQIKLALDYIRRHVDDFDQEAMKLSPLWQTPQPPFGNSITKEQNNKTTHCPDVPGWPSADGYAHHMHHDQEGGMLISSLI